MKLAIKVI